MSSAERPIRGNQEQPPTVGNFSMDINPEGGIIRLNAADIGIDAGITFTPRELFVLGQYIEKIKPDLEKNAANEQPTQPLYRSEIPIWSRNAPMVITDPGWKT